MNQAQIGQAIADLPNDVKKRAVVLVAQFRAYGLVPVLKQAVDTPHRARAQLTAWMAEYDSRKGAGAAQTFLAACLTAANAGVTLAQVNTQLTALENAALALVAHVQNDGWSWDQVASAITQQLAPAAEESFSFESLPIPASYSTVWGEPW